jgi:hypothetical protein
MVIEEIREEEEEEEEDVFLCNYCNDNNRDAER